MAKEKLVKMTVRIPPNLSEAMDKAVELGIFQSKNELALEAIKEYLRILGFAISVHVKVKKKAKGPIDYYQLLAEELNEALSFGIGETYTLLSQRIGIVMMSRSVEEVEVVGDNIVRLVDLKEKEGTANSGEDYMAGNHLTPKQDKGGGSP